MAEWEGIDRAKASPIVRDAIAMRDAGSNWTEIGDALGVHRTTISRWARGVSKPPPEAAYISRDEARKLSQTARLSVDRRDAARNLKDFVKPTSKYAPRRTVNRSFVKDGKRHKYKTKLARGNTKEQAKRMKRLGKKFEQNFREKYSRFGDVGEDA